VTNTGQRAGTQVVQVDVGGADGTDPPRRLEGFAKVSLRPGQHRHVVVRLDAHAFAHWYTATQSWVTPAGNYTIYAGTSSRDLPLSTQVSVR
jgi:beta-glucosidase